MLMVLVMDKENNVEVSFSVIFGKLMVGKKEKKNMVSEWPLWFYNPRMSYQRPAIISMAYPDYLHYLGYLICTFLR